MLGRRHRRRASIGSMSCVCWDIVTAACMVICSFSYHRLSNEPEYSGQIQILIHGFFHLFCKSCQHKPYPGTSYFYLFSWDVSKRTGTPRIYFPTVILIILVKGHCQHLLSACIIIVSHSSEVPFNVNTNRALGTRGSWIYVFSIQWYKEGILSLHH